MIVVLGASGYVGSAFVEALTRRDRPFLALSRRRFDYTRFDTFLSFLRSERPELVINAAGYSGKPNVDACEAARADTLQGNVLFPLTLAHACLIARVALGHVSSGCIYSGAKVRSEEGWRVERDLAKPAVRSLLERRSDAVRGFDEGDMPNFTFREGPCSFYSGTKALAEEALAGFGQAYLWRLRIPFDERDAARNFLTKVQRYLKVYDNFNSLSQRFEFANACLDLWDRRAPFGIYNLTNPGYLSTREVVELIHRILQPRRAFEFWANDEEFYTRAARAPRSNCLLDVSKALSAGVTLRPVEEAVEAALSGWTAASER